MPPAMATRHFRDGTSHLELPDLRNGGPAPLARLSLELLMNILEQLCPVGSLTTYESNAARPEIRSNHVESRSAFAKLCCVSKSIRPHATRYLYSTVLLRDQKELLCFFRTIANNHDLRPIIRSFAWVGILSTDDTNLESTTRRDKEMACLSPDCWASINWPSNPTDSDIARLVKIDGPDTLQSWRVLGAVLAMAPRIRSMLLLLAHTPVAPPKLPPCPEKDAIWGLMWPPKSRQFLQELDTITLEPHSNKRTECWVTEKTLMALLVNSLSARRVELKGTLFFRSMQQHAQKFWDREIISESTKELLRFRARQPQEDMMALTTMFPKLVSLEAEYDNGSRELDDSDSTVSKALNVVAGTLQTLSLTTSPGNSWSDANTLPLLPNLNQMGTLKHLTTESIWLFGGQDPYAALPLPDLLPTSLVRFHLIDYWGSSRMDTFCPKLPEPSSLLGFYDQVFSGLHEKCSTQLPNLKDIKLALNYFRFHTTPAGDDTTTTTDGGGDGPDLPADVRAFLYKFQILFASVGVRFSVFAPEILAAELQSSWAIVC